MVAQQRISYIIHTSQHTKELAMKAATVGQREQAIKTGNIRPGVVAPQVKFSTAASRAKSLAQAIAARRKEMRK